MSLQTLTRFFEALNDYVRHDVGVILRELGEHIDERIRTIMRADLQPLADKLTELAQKQADEHASTQAQLDAVKAAIIKLQGQGSVSAADLQPLLDQVSAIGAGIDADKAALDTETAAAQAI